MADTAEQSPEQKALQLAIEGLYTTFASYPLRDVMEGCLHCLQEIDADRLHTVPLRLLTKDDLDFFLDNSAALTVGNAADFKHFLPRLFELMARWRGPYSIIFAPELMGCGVALHGYTAWPQAEQQAVQTFCLAWWKALLSTAVDSSVNIDERVDTLLCAISQFTEDLGPYLEAWHHMRTGRALAHLVVFIWYHQLDADAKRRRSSWWCIRERQWEQIAAWVRNPATAAWMRERWDHTNHAKQEPDSASSQFLNQMLDRLASEPTNKEGLL